MNFYKETDFQETPLGKFPRDWDVTKLEDICEKVRAGGTPLTSKEEYWNGDLPFVKIEDITLAGKYLTVTKSFISKEGLSNSNAWIVPENSLLFAMYGSMGEVSINKILVTTNQAILGIIPQDRDDVEFLYYWYSFFKPKWKKYAKPTTQANLTAEIVRNSMVPLPTKMERRGIVGVLGVVDSVIAKTGEVIAKTERLKKGLMQTLLTRGIGHKEYKQTPIGTIPKEWEVVKVKDVANLQSGGTPSRDKPEYWENGTIPWIKSGELNDAEIYNAEEKITELGLKNSNAKIFPKGTLLMALYGKGTVSKTAILRIDAATNQAVCAFTPKNGNFNPKYMQHCLIFMRNRLLNQLTNPSSDVGRTNIYMGMLESFKIPLPKKVEEQKKIAEILSTADEELNLLRSEKLKFERIKRGLMDLLLTGKIRVKV
jgi:type I restriction enzyme S subunit